MKAPFSKKAKAVFASRRAVRTINELKTQGKSLNNVRVRDRNGKIISIRTARGAQPH